MVHAFWLVASMGVAPRLLPLLLVCPSVADQFVPEPSQVSVPPHAHVINLKHRPERLKAFEDRVQGIMSNPNRLDYSVLRASDSKDAQEAIDSGLVRLDPQWVDQSTARKGMTLGEVGCALSHVRAWRLIAKELGPNPEKYAIVLEDDAALSVDFPSRIGGVVASARENRADFVYLAYRFSGNLENERIQVDEHLQTCVFNWWALAYMVSGSAAAKLASSSEAYLRHLIPVDEYLPIVLGTKDGYRENKSSYSDLRIKCLAVRGEQLAKPGFDSGFSDTELGDLALTQTQVDHDQKEHSCADRNPLLRVFTMATDSDHFGYGSLKRSAAYFGHTLINVGEGKKWEGYNTKLILMKEALKQMDDDQLVLFVDGYDTILQRSPEEIIARFKALMEHFQQRQREQTNELGHTISPVHEAVFFGAERFCWPSEDVCAQYKDETASYSSQNPYLNSGTYIGRAGLIRALLEDVNSARPDDDDQLFFSEKLAHYVQSGDGIPIFLDSDGVLFQALLGSQPEWTIEEGVDNFFWLKNKNGVIPAVLHGQGPAKHTLMGISNYIPGSFTDFYGTKRHTHVQTDAIYPLMIGLFFTERTDIEHEKQFLASITSLDIHKSQTQIFVYSTSSLQMRRVYPALDGQYASCVNATETDEALARAEFLSLAALDGAARALMVDSDVVVKRMSLVQDLAGWSRPVVVGNAQRPGELWSNYWTDMDHNASGQWYTRGFDTVSLYNRERRGLFQVPFGRALVLVHQTELKRLAGIFAKQTGSGDDTVRRACLAATDVGLGIYVDNRYEYAALFDPDKVKGQTNLDYSSLFSSNDNSALRFKKGTLPIPRERSLSLKDYFEKYEDTQTPVIIEDYADTFKGITIENIIKVCGDHEVSVARRDSEKGLWANIKTYKHGMLRDAVQDVSDHSKESRAENFTAEEGSILGVFDWSLQKYCPELLESHFVVPKYISQDFLQRVPHDKELKYRDSWPSLFIGVNGTYGGMHRDVFGSAFWMYAVEGAKEWHVIDSADGTDMFKSKAGPVRHYHDVVHKGQLIIIPGDRWHQVRNRGTTLSLAGNFVSRGSFETMRREVEGKTNSYYQQLQSTLLAPGFNISVCYDKKDVSWSEFRHQTEGI